MPKRQEYKGEMIKKQKVKIDRSARNMPLCGMMNEEMALTHMRATGRSANVI